MGKNYLGCSIEPPTLTPSVLRNLGASFCKVNEKDLSDAALFKKKKILDPIGKRTVKKKANPDDNDAVEQKKEQNKPQK